MKHGLALSGGVRLITQLGVGRQVGLSLSLLVLLGCSTPRVTTAPQPKMAMPVPVPVLVAMPVPVVLSTTQQPDVQEAKSVEKSTNSPEPERNETLVDWWRYFGNSELEALIDRGLSNNPDIRIALNRLIQAKARADWVGAAGKKTTLAPPLATAEAPTQVNIRADWRLDIWGEPRVLADSAHFQLWRAVYERENVQRNLAATLAAAYVEYLSINDRLRIALETEESLSATLLSVEKRVNKGDAALSEFEQQKAAIFSVRASIPALEQQRLDTINVLAFLLGTVPSDINLSDVGLDSLIIPGVISGVYSNLLLRRPDILVAEAQLMAAGADVEGVRARILPQMDLTAQALLPRASFTNLVDSVTVSIFDSAKKKNDPLFSQAVQEEMVESYVRTVHQAMREVESALTTVNLAARRLAAQQETIAAARRAWNISAKVYAVGGIDHLALLDTQRSYHRYLDEYQKTRMEYYRGYISLFHALGGGVKPGEALAVNNRISASDPMAAASIQSQSYEGIPINEGSGVTAETFWQVELAGLYHRLAISAIWRDFRTRFPDLMGERILIARLNGRFEESHDGMQSWHRVYVAKFGRPEQAEAFCQALKGSQQRCRVVSSQFDETLQINKPSKAALLSAIPVLPSPAVSSPVVVQDKVETNALPEVDEILVNKVTEPEISGEQIKETHSVFFDNLAYSVQLAAFSRLDNASHAQNLWRQKGYDVYRVESKDAESRVLYVLRSGVYALKEDAMAAAQAIHDKETVPAVVVAIMVDRQGNPVAPSQLDQETPVKKEIQKTGFSVQFGAFANKANAERTSAELRAKGVDSGVTPIRDHLNQLRYAVRAGYFAQRRDATAIIQGLGRHERSQVLLVRVAAKPSLP